MNNSLDGLRILNTRPKNQAIILSQLIHQANGISIQCPTLEITQSTTDWIKGLPDLDEVDYAIFISANAVTYCFNELAKHNLHWPKHIYVIAIGQGTAKSLHHYQIRVDNLPLTPESEHVLVLMNQYPLQDKKILLFKGEGGRTLIEEGLRQKQATLNTFTVYQRTMPAIDCHYINSLWRNDAVDIILLTSEQSIQNLFKLFSREAHPWLQDKPCLVISERLAQAASLAGIKKTKLSHPNRIIETLLDYKDYIHG
jgi:uroporphyrinogen-III synthase